jgi:hypothetical protein
MDDKKVNKYNDLIRPSVPLSDEEHSIIAKFCLEKKIPIGRFLAAAGLLCIEKNMIPPLAKKFKK